MLSAHVCARAINRPGAFIPTPYIGSSGCGSISVLRRYILLVYHLPPLPSSIMRPLDSFGWIESNETEEKKNKNVNKWMKNTENNPVHITFYAVFVIKLMIVYIVALNIMSERVIVVVCGVNKSVFSCLTCARAFDHRCACYLSRHLNLWMSLYGTLYLEWTVRSIRFPLDGLNFNVHPSYFHRNRFISSGFNVWPGKKIRDSDRKKR